MKMLENKNIAESVTRREVKNAMRVALDVEAEKIDLKIDNVPLAGATEINVRVHVSCDIFIR